MLDYKGVVVSVIILCWVKFEFLVGVEFHQGSALSPYLFELVMDKIMINLKLHGLCL